MVIRYFNLPRSMARKRGTIGLNQSLRQMHPFSPNPPSFFISARLHLRIQNIILKWIKYCRDIGLPLSSKITPKPWIIPRQKCVFKNKKMKQRNTYVPQYVHTFLKRKGVDYDKA
jgi:hypothetical protein